MKNDKKNSLFSWLSSKIRTKKPFQKKIIKTKEVEKRDDLSTTNLVNQIQNDKKVHDHTADVTNLSLLKNDIETNNIDGLINNTKDTDSIDARKVNFFTRLKKSLQKTKQFLGDGISHLFLSKTIDKEILEDLEEKMLLADIGFDTTEQIITSLNKELNRKDLNCSKKVYYLLKQHMYTILKKVEQPLRISHFMPFVILVVGVNGTGKTTTVSKLAQKYKLQGKSVMLAAADTFRAAGIEQLQILGTLNKIPVFSKSFKSDPASVVFDALQSAKSKKIDILIVDTAGRLHNKMHLMEELKKIVRVIKKIDVSAPHEIILIVDACNGQNTIQQTEIFNEALNLTGMIITKLDGTAKGGVVFSLANQFKIPIRYIGIGEKTQDLDVFNSKEFIDAIFDQS